MRAAQLSFSVSPELVSEIRDYFRHEADTIYSDEAIIAAINWWLESRLENIYEEIGEVLRMMNDEPVSVVVARKHPLAQR